MSLSRAVGTDIRRQISALPASFGGRNVLSTELRR
jgi:hypothetical protein